MGEGRRPVRGLVPVSFPSTSCFLTGVRLPVPPLSGLCQYNPPPFLVSFYVGRVLCNQKMPKDGGIGSCLQVMRPYCVSSPVGHWDLEVTRWIQSLPSDRGGKMRTGVRYIESQLCPEP